MISIRSARRAGVPLVAIETADPRQTIDTIINIDLNGKKDSIPLASWDIVRALLPLNQAGGKMIDLLCGSDSPQIASGNPTQCLSLIEKAPADAIIFFHNAQRFWENEQVMQGIWNLRDIYKGNGSMLILLCNSIATLPSELKNDIIVLADPLPTPEEIQKIVKDIAEAAKLPDLKEDGKIVDTLTGISAFGVEQVFAMSINPKEKTIDLEGLWNKKRGIIEQTKGLQVWRGGETFAQIGGSDNAKDFLRRICSGKKPPKAIIFIDEIEKAMAGSASDTSGTSQDQLLKLLTFMQDEDASGMIFVGPPGSGKSAIAKAAGNEAGIPTISLDLGGMKGSLVGSSEGAIRQALSVAKAVSQGELLFIATCNSIGILPPELRRRFSLGTFFFPLPSKEDRKKIWDIYRKKFNLSDDIPEDEGWTGAEIRNCCFTAWRTGQSLKEAAINIVPVSISAADQIDKLCRDSHRKYISASVPGIYEYERLIQPTNKARRVE